MQKFYAMLEKHSKYFLAAIIILIPLYPKFPFLKIPGTYVSIRLEDFLIAMVALLLIPKLILNIKLYLKNKVIWAILIFLLVGFVSFLSGIFLTKTVIPYIGFLHFFRRIEYFVPLLAGYIMLREEGGSERALGFLVKCLMIVVFAAFIYGLGQRYLDWPIIITQNEEYSKGIALRFLPGSHINSTFAGHYDLASFLVLVLPILITSFFIFRERWTKVILGIVILSGLWLLTNSVSRISVVSYLGAVTLALLLIGKYKEIFLVIFVSLIFFMTSASLMGRYLNLGVYAEGEKNAQEEMPAPVIEDRSTSIRFNVEWPRAIRAFTKNPLLGTGYSSITLATDNDFLRLLGEVGILGFITFVVVLVRINLVWFKSFPITQKFTGIEVPFLAGVIGAFPGILLNSMFIDVFEASKFATVFWLLVGLSLFLVEKKINEQII